jgi:hypothetical protein
VSNQGRNHDAPPRRAGYRGGFGQVLAAVALLLQIALPSLHRPLLLILENNAGDLNASYDEHTLCLAPNSSETTPQPPVDRFPKSTHHDFLGCCPWNGSTGFALPRAPTIEPVTFGRSVVSFNPLLDDTRTLFPAAVRARGPPVRV